MPKRVTITTDHDAMAAIEAVHADGEPREIERNGETIAIVFPPEGSSPASDEALRRALAAGGSWKGLGGEDLAEKVHQWRELSPPSPPVEL